MARHFLVSVGSLSGARIFVALSQILILPILARQLDVTDFGDIAIAMTVVLFAQLLSDGGLGRSLIRQETYQRIEWSSVFWLLVAVGLGLTGLLIAIAPLWAGFFERPSLQSLIMALSVVPLLYAVSAVSTAKLERDKRFPTIGVVQVIAAIAGMIAAVSLALAGAGAWALAAQQIILATIHSLSCIALAGFRPLSPMHRVPLREHLTFAGNSISVSLLTTAQRQVPIMLIGQSLGAATLGLFAMSQRIHNLPLFALAAPASRVVFGQMSRAQKTPARIVTHYLSSIFLLSFLVFPPVAVLAGIGETAFAVLLSEPWKPAAVIFALAAPGVALDAVTSHAGVLFQAVNRTEIRLRMVTERTVLRIVLLAAALPFGIEATAASITATAILFQPRQWFHLGRAIPFQGREVLITLAGPLVAAGVAWLGCLYIDSVATGIDSLLLALGYLAVIWASAAVVLRRKIRSALASFSG